MSNQEKEDKKRPAITVAVFIMNDKDEVFLMRSSKWSDKLVPPGGHIEDGEKAEEAAIREVKEETGLDIDNLEFLTAIDVIYPSDFLKRKNAHFVGLEYRARLVDPKQKVVLDDREGQEYLWVKPKQVIERNDVENHTKRVIEEYLIPKSKRNIFSKRCKNCEKNQEECQEYKQGWQRALADYKNLQKEIQDKKSEWVKMSEVQILEEFIPVYENFKKAFAIDKKEDDSWAQGIEYIMKQFYDVLAFHGIQEIKTVGENFDPKSHEAVSEEDVEDQESGLIIREISGGYQIGNKILKAAQVVVVK
ncbi:MAG: nucleotide exchange factor GrpE [bacterium]